MTSLKKSPQAAQSVEELLKEAQDPSTTVKRLQEIWNLTKSSRVRRAVASNHNADKKIMVMAARLYIREVIENPGFEIINLFAEEKTIKEIYDAYMDPSSAKTLPSYKGEHRTNIARAMLISPNLKNHLLLESICSQLSSLEFSREMKDPEVRKRIEKLAKGVPGVFRLPTLIFLESNGILNTEDLAKSYEKMQSGHSRATTGSYVNYCLKYAKMASEDPKDKKILCDFVRINSYSMLRELAKAIKKDPSKQNDKLLEEFSQIYRKFLEADVEVKREMNRSHKKKYGYGFTYRLDDQCHSHHLSDLIWTIIGVRNDCFGKNIADIDLKSIYKDVCAAGFDSDYGPYKCEIKFPGIKTLSDRNEFSRKLMEIEDDRAFLFFITCGIFPGQWYAKGSISNPENEVVKRLHRINRERLEKGEPLLYSKSVLEDFPYIDVIQTNGLEYDPSKYLTLI